MASAEALACVTQVLQTARDTYCSSECVILNKALPVRTAMRHAAHMLHAAQRAGSGRNCTPAQPRPLVFMATTEGSTVLPHCGQGTKRSTPTTESSTTSSYRVQYTISRAQCPQPKVSPVVRHKHTHVATCRARTATMHLHTMYKHCARLCLQKKLCHKCHATSARHVHTTHAKTALRCY